MNAIVCVSVCASKVLCVGSFNMFQKLAESNASNEVLFATVLQAVRRIMPLCVAVIPWGILTGALAIKAGFSPLQAQFMSLFVFAGAAQLSAITLYAGGGSVLAIGVSTFVISSRHLLYSMTFRQHISHKNLAWRLSIGFLLTDEMFAVSETHTRQTGYFSALFALVSGLTFYLFWNLATYIGIVSGNYYGDLATLGLDFAIVAIFITMTFTEIRKFPVLVAVVISGCASIVLEPIIGDSYIVVAAITGMVSAYLCSSYLGESGNRGES